MDHTFIFHPGTWLGEGKISFTGGAEQLQFYTKWTISQEKEGIIRCEQRVEMVGRDEDVYNIFIFSEITKQKCAIELTNELLGTVRGKVVLDPTTIAWEFRGHPEFEGFEVYEKYEKEYLLHAEYAAPDQVRTVIEGRVWKAGS